MALRASFVLLAMAVASSANAAMMTRYWDCCKPSSAWPGKADVKSPVQMCQKDGVTPYTGGANGVSACDGGDAYVCSNLQPFSDATNDKVGFGFAAFPSNNESQTSCACYHAKVNGGKQVEDIIFQAINIGGDVNQGNVDLQIPGGGVGAFPQGCQRQWNAPATGWGIQYGGVASESDCSQLPETLQKGCKWRFEAWGDNPTFVTSPERVRCPKSLINLSKCQRNDEESQKGWSGSVSEDNQPIPDNYTPGTASTGTKSTKSSSTDASTSSKPSSSAPGSSKTPASVPSSKNNYVEPTTNDEDGDDEAAASSSSSTAASSSTTAADAAQTTTPSTNAANDANDGTTTTTSASASATGKHHGNQGHAPHHGHQGHAPHHGHQGSKASKCTTSASATVNATESAQTTTVDQSKKMEVRKQPVQVSVRDGRSAWMTNYDDCCIQSGSWSGKADVYNPVKACYKNGTVYTGINWQMTSSCSGTEGNAYTCPDMLPYWDGPAPQDEVFKNNKKQTILGFAAIKGDYWKESDTECACYETTLASRNLQDDPNVWKENVNIIYQVTNIGGLDEANDIDLLTGTAGMGALQKGCPIQYPGAPWDDGSFGGKRAKSYAECKSWTPTNVCKRAGCNFLVDLPNNPWVTKTAKRVACPARLLAMSQCQRKDDYKYQPSSITMVDSCNYPPTGWNNANFKFDYKNSPCQGFYTQSAKNLKCNGL
ncbi:hypothetical protein ACQY0O_003643 [Thecaphora frezii]